MSTNKNNKTEPALNKVEININIFPRELLEKACLEIRANKQRAAANNKSRK